MQIHIFAFRWKPHATLADKERAMAAARAFAGVIPGLIEVHVGTNTSAAGQGFETGGVMKFVDRAALDAYNVHPLHRELLAWLLPLIDPIEVDFDSAS